MVHKFPLKLFTTLVVISLSLASTRLMAVGAIDAETVGSISWTNNAGWDVGSVPGPSDTAIINSGTLTVDGAFSIGRVRFGNGTITGLVNASTNSLTITGNGSDSEWDDGTISNLSLIVASGATLQINDSSGNTLSAGNLVVNSGGTVDWNNGDLYLNNNSTVTVSGIFNAQSSQQIRTTSGATGTFTIAAGGEYNQYGSGTSVMLVDLQNHGGLYVEAGTLQIKGGGTTYADGFIDTAVGTVVEFHSDFLVADASTLNGSGQYEIEAGALTLEGEFNAHNFEIEGGTLLGNHSFNNSATWLGGSYGSGNSTIGSDSTFNLQSSTGHTLSSRHINNNGATNWTIGDLLLNSGSTITNNLVFSDTAAGLSTDTVFIKTTSGATGAFINSLNADYNKTSAGTTRVLVPFTNDGALNVNAGTFVFGGTGALSSSGTMDIGSTSEVIIASNVSIADASTITGNGQLTLNTGTLTMSGNLSAGSFSIEGGALSGTHSLQIAVDWTGGSLSNGTSTLLGTGIFDISGTADNTFTNHTFHNLNQTDWNSGELRLNSNSLFDNQGTFNDYAASNSTDVVNIRTTSGATGAFANTSSATFNKNGSGKTNILVDFTNEGRVNVYDGTLVFSGGGSTASTSLIDASGSTAAVEFASTFTVDDAYSLTGLGTYRLTAGTLTLNGVMDAPWFEINDGTLIGGHTFNQTVTFNGGAFGTGATTIGSTGSFTLNGSASNTFADRDFTNSGDTNWSTGEIRLNSDSSFLNVGTFDDNAAANSTDVVKIRTTSGATGAFTNAADATYTQWGTGTTEVLVPFTNHGSLAVNGTFIFGGSGTNSVTGTIDTGSTGQLVIASNVSIENAANLTGSGQLTLNAGTLTLDGNLSANSFTLNGGALSGTHDLQIGTLWQGGSLANGASTVSGSGTLGISGAFDNTLTNHVAHNLSQTNWNSGELRLNSGSHFDNQGTFNDYAASNSTDVVKIRTTSGATGTFENAASATYNKYSLGTTDVRVDFSNFGTVNVHEGTLVLSGGGSTTSTSLINASGSTSAVEFASTFAVDDAYSLTGLGTYRLTAGSLTLNGVMNAPLFEIIDGTLLGSHTLNQSTSFSGGSFGTGATTIASTGSLLMNAGTYNTLTNRELTNNGVTTWNDGELRLNAGSSFVNNGTFYDHAAANSVDDQDIRTTSGSTGSFTNSSSGTYHKDSLGTTRVLVPFNHDGILNLNQGAMLLQGGGAIGSTAQINAAAGTQFYFQSNVSVTDAASLLGDGEYRLESGALTLFGTFSAPRLTIDGGTLSGSPTLSTEAVWSAGTINASSLDLAFGASMTLSGTPDHPFSGTTFSNHGTVNWNDGKLLLNQGALLDNFSLFNVNTSGPGDTWYIKTTSGSTGSLTNRDGATLTVNGGADLNVGLALNNDGEVRVAAGNLILAGGGSTTATGSLLAETGTEIIFSQNYAVSDFQSLTGEGTFVVEGGTLVSTGTLGTNLTVDGGNLSGDIAIDGQLTLTSGTIESGHAIAVNDYGTLSLQAPTGLVIEGPGLTIAPFGTVQWLDGNLIVAAGTNLINHGLLTSQVVAGTIAPGGSGAMLFNDGTISIAAGSSSLEIQTDLQNDGIIDVQGGELVLSGDSNVSAGGSVNLQSGTALRITAGTTTIADADSLSGEGGITMQGGELVLSGRLENDLHLINGVLNTDVMQMTHDLRISGGAFANETLIELIDGGRAFLETDGFALPQSSGFDVDSNSEFRWVSGDIGVGDFSGFAIDGLFFAESDHTMYDDSAEVTADFTIGATGSFRKTGGSGVTAFTVPVAVAGRFEVHTGTVELNTTGKSLGGLFDIWSGSTLNLNDGFTFEDGTIVQNGGSLNLLNGSFVLQDRINLGSHTTLVGGTFSGTHTIEGNVTWTGGAFDSGGTTTIGSGGRLILANPAGNDLDRDFVIDGGGEIAWTSGQVVLDGNLSAIGSLNIATDGNLTTTSTGSIAVAAGGSIVKTAGAGVTTISVPVTNAGSVSAQSGTLHFAGSFDLAGGALRVSNGGLITFAAPLALSSTTTLAGNGTITANITTGGTVSPGASVGSLTIDGDLTLTSGAISFFEIDTVDSVLAFDRLTVSGTLALAGDLQIDFLTTVDPISTDMFTLYTAATLQGEFANVANGGQVWTDLSDGGRGSFTVNYGPSSLFDANSVVLTNFEFSPIPEPSTWMLMVAGLALIGFQTRRRRA